LQHTEIKYLIDYQDSSGNKRGQEPCFLTIHTDGQKTLRARSEIFDSKILRDVVYTVTDKFRPIDCYIRIRQNDSVIGTSWFTFDEKETNCSGLTINEGQFNQSMPTIELPDSFISHAVSTDVWHCANIKKDNNLGIQLIPSIPSCSPLPNGASGPMLCISNMYAEYIGIENIEVPAGNFESEHVKYYEENGKLWLEMWCTNNSNRIMLQMYYPVYDSFYYLSEIEINN
tara:strand:+ start:1904 stop:2590 length:687 start_codon:yes stop_codon:yes gene_type:complete